MGGPPGGIAVTENGMMGEPPESRYADMLYPPQPQPFQARLGWRDWLMGRKGLMEDWNETMEDPRRTRYLRAYLAALHEAQMQGADVRAYFAWSFLDNFEWGPYTSRFGIVRVDYDTQKHTLKRSARVY